MRNKTTSLIFLTLAAASLAWPQAPTVGNCTVFPANNIWNTPVDTLPVSPNSTTYVNTIGASTSAHADFGSGTYNGAPFGIPYITVPGTQTKYPVTFLYADESDAGPYAIPLNAPIEGGSNSTGDRHAIAVDVDNCILYELYNAHPQTSSWTADSGSIFNLTSNALRPAGWTSADAAGLPIMPGLVRYDEVAAGEIRHALRFTVPSTQRAYVWPARHYASSITNTAYPPMGQRFRLKASFDITSYPADVQVILKALKKYGMMIADNGSAWYVSGTQDDRWNNSDLSTMRNLHGSDFEAVDVSSLMVDPNSGQALQSSSNPAPAISSVTPNPVTAGNFTLTVNGSNFQSGAVVRFNGTALATTFVSAAQLTASGSTSTTSSAVPVTVTNPDGQVSAAYNIAVTGSGPVSVTVSPSTASVRIKGTKQFTATVQNTSNTKVTWYVNNIANGNSTVGTIGSAGLYRAPGSVPSPNTVTIKAVSAADTTKSGTATVTITRR